MSDPVPIVNGLSKEENRLFGAGKYNLREQILLDCADGFVRTTGSKGINWTTLNFKSTPTLFDTWTVYIPTIISAPSGVQWTGDVFVDGVCPSQSNNSIIAQFTLNAEGNKPIVSDGGLAMSLSDTIEKLTQYSANWLESQGYSYNFALDTANNLNIPHTATGAWFFDTASGTGPTGAFDSANYTGPVALSYTPLALNGQPETINTGYYQRLYLFSRQAYWMGTEANSYYYVWTCPLRELHSFFSCPQSRIPFMGRNLANFNIQLWSISSPFNQFPPLNCPSGVPTIMVADSVPAGFGQGFERPQLGMDQPELTPEQNKWVLGKIANGWDLQWNYRVYNITNEQYNIPCTAGSPYVGNILNPTINPQELYMLTYPHGWISQDASGYASPLTPCVPKYGLQIKYDNRNYNQVVATTQTQIWQLITELMPGRNMDPLWGALLSFDELNATYQGLWAMDVSPPGNFDVQSGVNSTFTLGTFGSSAFTGADNFPMVVTNQTTDWRIGKGSRAPPIISSQVSKKTWATTRGLPTKVKVD